MNVKTCFIFFIVMLFLSVVLGGCKSTGISADTSGDYLEDSRRIGELQARVDFLEKSIRDSEQRTRDLVAGTRDRLDSALRRSDDIEDTFERILYLVGEYSKEVERLFAALEREGQGNRAEE